MTPAQNTHYDALIIGQGLAGSLLAWELIQQGQKVLVIDKQHSQSSSMVAAGIINPITGHRINLTHDFSKFISIATDTYRLLTSTLNCSFFSAIPQQRLIKNNGQHSYYLKRLKQAEYLDFLLPLSEQNDQKKNQNAFFRHTDYSIARIQQTYRVDSQSLLQALKEWLISQQALLLHALDYDELTIEPNKVFFKNHQSSLLANNIIFCEGFQAIHNPWLQDLPFKLAKGEILTLALQKKYDSIYNWGHWLLPLTNSEEKAFLGANYEWNNQDVDTNQKIASELMQSMQKQTNISGKIIDHKAGIRPTTINRKPFIGSHPKHPNLYCFNGFGSKGCLIIPHYAKLFAQHFTNKTSLTELLPELETTLILHSE